MNIKETINASGASNGTKTFFSAGEIFPDGALIELVSASSGLNKPDLLLWDGSQTTIGPRLEHSGCLYEAPELCPSLYLATRLPSHCTDYGSVHSLTLPMSCRLVPLEPVVPPTSIEFLITVPGGLGTEAVLNKPGVKGTVPNGCS